MQDAAALTLAGKGLAVALWFAFIFAAERVCPATVPRLAEPAWRRLLRNAGFWVINAALSPLVVLPVSAWAAGHALIVRPHSWDGAWALILDLLALDLFTYWWHRANHELPVLWRFHSVHHLDRTLDASTAVRFHFGEVLLGAGARTVIVVLFAVPLGSIVAFEAVLLMAAVFHHSNLKLPARFEAALARVLVTPSIHWVHHHRRRDDTDANYATVLSLWDALFGSRAATRRSPDMEIGVEGRDEAAFPALLLAPFQPRGSVQ